MPSKKPRAENYIGSTRYEAIKKDLTQQLEANGTVGEYYGDLINDYMDLWVTKCMLVEDVRTRGLYVRYNNGGGQSGTRKNESVDQLLKTNAQMLKLLSELGIKPSQGGGEDDDL